jgi:hypothetical protein
MKCLSVLFLLMVFSFQRIEGLENYVLKFEKIQKQTFMIHFRSRAKFGSHFVKIHQFEENNTNSIQLSFHQQDSTIYTTILGNQTISKEILISSLPNWRVFVYDEMIHQYQFNTTLMKEFFNSSFFLTCGVNYHSHELPPTVQTTFNMEFEKLNLDYFWDYMSKPNHVQFYHPALFSIFMLVKVIELILCVLFFKVQPLRSRGFVPIMSVVISSMLEIGQTYYFASFQFNTLYAERIDSFVYLPFGWSVYAIIPLGFVHFLILTFIQRQKLNFIQQKTQNMKIQYKILKWLSHPIVIVIVVLLLTLFFLLFINIVYIFNLQSLQLYTIIYVIIMCIFILLMLFDVVTLIVNYFVELSKRKSNWKEKIFFLYYLIKKAIQEDNYYFRLQYHIFGLVLASSMSFVWTRQFVWAYWIMTFIGQVSISGAQCEFILMVTILKWVLNLKKPPVIPRKDIIQETISNPILNELLQKFCEIGNFPFY